MLTADDRRDVRAWMQTLHAHHLHAELPAKVRELVAVHDRLTGLVERWTAEEKRLAALYARCTYPPPYLKALREALAEVRAVLEG